METDPAALAVREALFLTLQLAGPPLLVMLAIGLVVSLLQALTQIQEATLAFLPKVVALGVVLLLLGPSMVGYMRGFAGQLFDRMVTAGRLAP
jgi:flagellar biosynthesis protein FliQ